MGQAVPEIPLSVGSKLELLLRAFVFAKFQYAYVHSRICSRNIAVYNIDLYVYTSYNTMYMTEAPRALHFNAFIICCTFLFHKMLEYVGRGYA